MKVKRPYWPEKDPAVHLLELIETTKEAIAKAHGAGDNEAVRRLIFEQRHNLKVLARQLKEAKGK